MASISRDKNGKIRILFTNPDGARKALHLGKTPAKAAEHLRGLVEKIVSARLLNVAIPDPAAKAVAELPEITRGKLERVGLIESQVAEDKPVGPTLEAFLKDFTASRPDVKPVTRRIWAQTQRLLVKYFGAERDLAGITRFEAKSFYASLADQYSPASRNKHTGFARQFFNAALDARLISENPFSGIRLGKRSNGARQKFIDHETIGRVMAGCTDPEFKLVLALSRFGGLRIPSELEGLKWQHIDRERGRILIHSPKTEHHEGKDTREIPLYPELVPYIDAWWEAGPEKSEYVIVSNRGTEAAWRTRLTKTLNRLGIPVWPRILQNLRSSRQTELELEYPSHIVCKWMGNSEAVAKEHYLQLTDMDFESATRNPTRAASARLGKALKSSAVNSAGISKNPEISSVNGAVPMLAKTPTGTDGNRTHLMPFQASHRV